MVQAAETPLPATEAETGIDLGLTHFAVLSGGRKIDSPRFLRRAEKKLKRAHKALSRKEKGPWAAGPRRSRVRAGRCRG
ncbi:transposase [Nonomuraea turkmeniaca]|uniref:transposase n=1 Tax=Nonomuraea turkmeniaca TaxID=103838 RepID=UPI003CCC7831